MDKASGVNFPSDPVRSAQPARISLNHTDEIQATIHADEPAIVLFNESYDAGWQAYVDGKPVPVFTANYNFMGCVVTAGEHMILFRYEPKIFYVSMVLSFLGLGVILMTPILVIFYQRRKKYKIAPRKSIQ